MFLKLYWRLGALVYKKEKSLEISNPSIFDRVSYSTRENISDHIAAVVHNLILK